MPKKLEVHPGDKYNRLTIIKEVEKRKGKRYVLCQCDCGKMDIVRFVALRAGEVKSCGCWKREKSASRMHEMATCRPNYSEHHSYYKEMYSIWHGMKQRCENPNRPHYEDYGGRGIKVCKEWQKFAPFQKWAHKSGWAPGLSIDRINSDGNYEPSNCRWITMEQQQLNRRNTVLLTLNGITSPLVEWAKIYHLPQHIIRNRLKNGWTVKEAITIPKQEKRCSA
jgi:hypothetical protein